MCDAELKRRKFFPNSENDEKCAANSLVIKNKKYLNQIRGYPSTANWSSSWPAPKLKWCPKANIYYAFNEDANPFTRVSELVNSTCDCTTPEDVKPHFPAPSDPFIVRDPYGGDEARYKQLETEPACFVIFGKPGLNTSRLAKLIADYWKCVIVSPEILLREEIEAKTDKGRWIKQVLRTGRSIGPEIVMNLIESRLNARDVLHRGYVIEGIPLIPNDPNLDYSSYPVAPSVHDVTPDSTVSFNTDDYDGNKNSKITSDQSLSESSAEEIYEDSETEETDQSISSRSSKSYDLARNPFATESLRMILRDDYQWDIGNQIDEMFTTWPIKPSVIIYAICPDPDVVRRRGQFRLDPQTGRIIDSGLLQGTTETQLRASLKEPSGMKGDKTEWFELLQEIIDEETLVHGDSKKHLVTRLSDMRSNVEIQCKIFESYALPCIERRVLNHNPQNVIRVDGRTSAMRMFQVVRMRLRILPLPRVILPRKISDVDEGSLLGGEETPVSLDEDEFYEGMTNEEAFQKLTNKGVVAQKYPWRLSQWNFFCPVALTRGRKIEGSAKHAVRFMSRLYFLSSSSAADIFIENPRPFLSSPHPKPICKILIYGPKYSGKSRLAEFLAQTYGGRVLDLQAIENREIDFRRNQLIRDAIDDILIDVIEEITDDLEAMRGTREATRIACLETWHRESQVLAKKLFHIFGNDPQGVIDNNSSKDPEAIKKRISELQDEIETYNLTSLCVDPDLRERISQDENILLDFAPMELRSIEAPVPELTEHDPEVAAILIERTQEARQATIELNAEDISQLLAANLNAAQTAPNLFGLEESGWVVDGMYANIDFLEKLLEKNVKIEEIVVIHEDEPYEHLTKKWRQNYRVRLAEDSVDDEEEDMNESNLFSADNMGDDIENIRSDSSIASDLEAAELAKYLDTVRTFDANCKEIIEKAPEFGLRIIDLKLSSSNFDLENYVKQKIEDHYRPSATVMTDEEKEREAENAYASEFDEEIDEEEEETARSSLPLNDNSRYGDTGVYCPVALCRHNVLWKGKEEFSALYMDKIYLLSSQAALDDFVAHPRELLPSTKPLDSIPVLKVSIVGPSGSGKSTLANAISREYGLVRVDVQERLDQYLLDQNIPSVGKNDENGEENGEEKEEAIELSDDLEDDKSIIRSFVRKYKTEGALLPKKILKESLLDFFQPDYSSVGLVLDNFPASSYDSDTACDNFAVPEIVIELICGAEESRTRMIAKLFDAWSKKQEERKHGEAQKFAAEVQDVIEKREKWVAKMMKQRRKQERVNSLAFDENVDGEDAGAEKEEMSEKDSSSKSNSILQAPPVSEEKMFIDSSGSGDSISKEPDDDEAEKTRLELLEKSLTIFPDPVKFDDWEDPEIVEERIRQEVDLDYDSSIKKLAGARAVFGEQSIPWIKIDAERTESSVLISALKLLDPYFFRNASALEYAYEVDSDTAEKILDCGYHFLSSFGRYCPVQMYEAKIPFQMYLPAEEARQIYPVVHREYVYFLNGKQRLDAFLDHPLKYLNQDSVSPLIPARIAVIGPPKCGKTTLANRFARAYGMKSITRGQALREILKNFAWTELATLTHAHLQGGHTALNESITRAVEISTIDSRGASQGYIFDGFPEDQSELEELALLGIQPMIVIDLRADLDFCLSCLALDSQTLSRPPTYSPCYLSHQYEEWEEDAEKFREWLSEYTQNLVSVDATAQKLAVWIRANEEVSLRFRRIKKYFREADFDKAHSLTYLCISPYEFRERQSKYESYCPVCLSADNILTISGILPNHEGMVQYREHYYWVCDSHLAQFLENPSAILSSLKNVELLEFRPEIIDQEIDVDHACWSRRLKVSGFCPVTYIDDLPQRHVIQGLNTLGVMFKNGLYLFCTVQCRDKFLRQPTKYADVEINLTNSLPPLKIKNLPNLGFLEQTVARLVVSAVNKVGKLRAKLPGMTPEVSAAVYIGVYLKIHNTESDLNEVAIYEEVLRRMDARRRIMEIAIRNAKKIINPFVSFPPCDKIRPICSAPHQTSPSSLTPIRSTSSTRYFELGEFSHRSFYGEYSI